MESSRTDLVVFGEQENTQELPVRQKRIGPSAMWLPVGKKGSIWLFGGTEEHKVRVSRTRYFMAETVLKYHIPVGSA